ncbi:MAG: hypothetical protein ABSF08_03900 [Candidatus Cybelea sp.]
MIFQRGEVAADMTREAKVLVVPKVRRARLGNQTGAVPRAPELRQRVPAFKRMKEGAGARDGLLLICQLAREEASLGAVMDLLIDAVEGRGGDRVAGRPEMRDLNGEASVISAI